MGAINPNKIVSKKQLEISQNLTKSLLSSISSYYNAHAIIENAVLAEENTKNTKKFLNDARAKFKVTSLHVKELSTFINISYGEFKATKEWIHYLDELSVFTKEIDNMLNRLNVLFHTENINISINNGSFQDSMWGDNINSDVRILSVECSILFSSIMNLHCQFVKDTHMVIKNAIAA